MLQPPTPPLPSIKEEDQNEIDFYARGEQSMVKGMYNDTQCHQTDPSDRNFLGSGWQICLGLIWFGCLVISRLRSFRV